MFYDRKIKYLDYYEEGVRVRGGGFVKLEARDTNLRLEVTVTGLHRNDSFTRDIVMIGRGQEHVIGRIVISGGRGQYRQVYQDIRDIAQTGMHYQELEGIYILLGAGRELSCNWPPIMQGGEQERGERSGILRGTVSDREGKQVKEGEQNRSIESTRGGRRVKEEERERRIGEEDSYIRENGAKEEKRKELKGKIEGEGSYNTGKGGKEGGREQFEVNVGKEDSDDGESGVDERRRKGFEKGKGGGNSDTIGEGFADRFGGEEEVYNGDNGGIRGNEIESRIAEETGRKGEDEANKEKRNELEEESRNKLSGGREYNRGATYEDEIHRNQFGKKDDRSYESRKEESGSGEIRMEEKSNSGNEMTGAGRYAGKGARRGNSLARGKGGMGGGRNGGHETGRNVGRATGESWDNRNHMQRGRTIIQEPAVNERERNISMEQQVETGKPVKLLEDKWMQLCAIYPHIHPFRDKREYLSIGPADFVLFPAASYKLVNNSFLLHGYYNYHHLILARVELKGEYRYYIGVPGGYFEKEKQVAIMFGFESFECEAEPAQTGDFGYYMMRTEL